MARAGKSPGSVFLSQNQSQAVGHWTFPGTAKKPASSLESALDPLPGANLAATLSLPQPHCDLPAAGLLPSILVRGRCDAGRTSASLPVPLSQGPFGSSSIHFCQHPNKQMHTYRDAVQFLLVAAGVWLSASL